MRDPESWLAAVISQATVLANEMDQLTDCLAAQGSSDCSSIDTYADALAAQLHQLETAADPDNRSKPSTGYGV